MLRAASRVIFVIAAGLYLTACSSSPGKVVTSTEDEVVISISKGDAKNVDTALQSAGEIATDECKKSGKMAKLDRSEDAAGGVVAYFDCVPPAETSN